MRNRFHSISLCNKLPSTQAVHKEKAKSFYLGWGGKIKVEIYKVGLAIYIITTARCEISTFIKLYSHDPLDMGNKFAQLCHTLQVNSKFYSFSKAQGISSSVGRDPDNWLKLSTVLMWLPFPAKYNGGKLQVLLHTQSAQTC